MPDNRSNTVIAFRDGLTSLPPELVERGSPEQADPSYRPGRTLGHIFSAMDSALIQAQHASSATAQPVPEPDTAGTHIQLWRGQPDAPDANPALRPAPKKDCGCGGAKKGEPLSADMQARIRRRLDELGIPRP
jgi:hypothetical protein